MNPAEAVPVVQQSSGQGRGPSTSSSASSMPSTPPNHKSNSSSNKAEAPGEDEILMMEDEEVEGVVVPKAGREALGREVSWE